jgi:hypothetical protein
VARKHGARLRKAQDKKPRNRSQHRPRVEPAPPDIKPDPGDPRDVASGWLRGVG